MKLNDDALPVALTVKPALRRSLETVAAAPLVPSPFSTSTWIEAAGTADEDVLVAVDLDVDAGVVPNALNWAIMEPEYG